MKHAKILLFIALFFLFLNSEFFGSIGILLGYFIGLTLGATMGWEKK